ncbi:hypothetical protein DD238_005001 [Peronospora effusa]|uniref:Uncharacterized protein n=1 Tax=Peronospora effusa TaxID=542832 RepID=A0A3M6VAI6_9STRA|nr:hypothetical protein DD238_005001 [Peronospora effusa]
MKNVIDAEHVGNARGRNEQLNLIVRSNTSTLNFAERKDAKLLGGLRYARASSMRVNNEPIALVEDVKPGDHVHTRRRAFRILDIMHKQLVSADKAYRMGKQLRALHRLEEEMRVQQTPEYLRLVFQKLMVKMLGLQISTIEKLMRNIQNELRSEPIPQAKLCKLFSLCDLNCFLFILFTLLSRMTQMWISLSMFMMQFRRR